MNWLICSGRFRGGQRRHSGSELSVRDYPDLMERIKQPMGGNPLSIRADFHHVDVWCRAAGSPVTEGGSRSYTGSIGGAVLGSCWFFFSLLFIRNEQSVTSAKTLTGTFNRSLLKGWCCAFWKEGSAVVVINTCDFLCSDKKIREKGRLHVSKNRHQKEFMIVTSTFMKKVGVFVIPVCSSQKLYMNKKTRLIMSLVEYRV